jgi:hypothetical protein
LPSHSEHRIHFRDYPKLLVIDFANEEVWVDWTSTMKSLSQELQSAIGDLNNFFARDHCHISGLTHKKQNELTKWLTSISKAEQKWNVIMPTLLGKKAKMVQFCAGGVFTAYANRAPSAENAATPAMDSTRTFGPARPPRVLAKLVVSLPAEGRAADLAATIATFPPPLEGYVFTSMLISCFIIRFHKSRF